MDPDLEVVLDFMDGRDYWRCPSCGDVVSIEQGTQKDIVFVVQGGIITEAECGDCHYLHCACSETGECEPL